MLDRNGFWGDGGSREMGESTVSLQHSTSWCTPSLKKELLTSETAPRGLHMEQIHGTGLCVDACVCIRGFFLGGWVEGLTGRCQKQVQRRGH